jgi:hypothetical protein
VALADYVCGMLIFSASLVAFSTLTASKLRLLDAAHGRQRALGAAETRLDALRLGGLPAAPAGGGDVDGFRKVQDFAPAPKLPAGWGRVDARALRLSAGQAHGLYEVRVTVGWRDVNGRNQLSLSTLAPPPGGGR